MCCTHSEERDEKLSKHQAGPMGGGVATRGTPTAAPFVTVGRDSKAAARGEAISRGGAAATNGGLPADILVRVGHVLCTLFYFACVRLF